MSALVTLITAWEPRLQPRSGAVLAVLLLALLALPAVAQAGTAGIVELPREGGGTARALLFVAGAGETNSTELYYEGDTVTVADTLAGGVTAGDGCTPVITAGSREVRCPLPGLEVAVLALGDGDDRQSPPNLDRVQRPCPIPLVIDAGDGNDVVVSCRDADTSADLGAGDDRLYVGGSAAVEARLGPGADVAEPFNGAAAVREAVYDGGPGDDVLVGTPAKEAFTGGDGRDRVTFPFNRVDANLDGQPGDAPEGDHVLGDVEELAAAAPGSTITGNDAANVLVSEGPGVTVRGLGGDDVLTGSDYGEVIEGGPGADRITGGFGDDVIDPGAGEDAVDADRQMGRGFAAGNDTVRARDGQVDRIGCGIGADVAEVDTADVTDACEQVDRAAAPGPGVGGSGPGPGAPGPGDDAGDRPPATGGGTLSVGRPGLRAALRRGLPVELTVARSAKVRITVTTGGRTVARATVRAQAGRPAKVRARFTTEARRRLGRKRRIALRVEAKVPGQSPLVTRVRLVR